MTREKVERNLAIKRAYERGMTCAEIAEVYNVSAVRVFIILRKLGVKMRPARPRPIAAD